jgi:endonuclease/exonuclease/phosphatase family metal-dependent hydrolase
VRQESGKAAMRCFNVGHYSGQRRPLYAEEVVMGEVTVAEPVVESEPEPEDQPSSVGSGRLRWWRRWLTGLIAAACVGWLALVVAHRFLSGWAYWWGPVDLAPPFVFALAPVVLLGLAQLARPARLRLTVVSALALVLGAGFSGINVAMLFYSPPPASSGAITVVSWNTEYWDQVMEGGAPRSTGEFYAFLRAMDADVYQLQEYAHVDLTLADVSSQALAIDHEALVRAAFPGYEVIIAGRNITLTRLPVLGHSWLDSTRHMPDDLKAVPAGLSTRPLFYQSQTLRTDIEVDGKAVSFYNSHIYQPPQRIFRLRDDPGRSMFEIDRFNAEIRRASFEAVAADMADNRNRIVWAGDFNTSPSMGILSMVPDRLVDQTRALSELYPTSWAADRDLWRLDWLFTTSDVAVSSYRLLDAGGFSDHAVQRIVLSAA